MDSAERPVVPGIPPQFQSMEVTNGYLIVYQIGYEKERLNRYN